MGWSYTSRAEKMDIVRERTNAWTSDSGAQYTCLRHTLRGNCLWMLMQRIAPDGTVARYIDLALLQCENGYGWGYKGICEQAHPYYYSCPLSYLAETNMGECAEWRDGVRAYHAKRAVKVTVGQKVRVTNGWVMKIQSVSPLTAYRADNALDYALYRLRKAQIDEVLV